MSEVAQKQIHASVLLDLYRSMRLARDIETLEHEFTRRGEAFLHVSGAGHEAAAALAPHLIKEDYLHVHYRDRALMIARGTKPEAFFLSFFSKDGSHSRGRQMTAYASDPEHNVLSVSGTPGSSGLQSAGIAEVIKDHPARPIVYCSVGDGSTQQGELLEGIGIASARSLPVLFVIQDNSISRHTGGWTFFNTPEGDAESFYNIAIQRINGRNVVEVYEQYGKIVAKMRDDRKPAIVVFEVDRPPQDEIVQVRNASDPISIAETALLEAGVPQKELDSIAEQTRSEVKQQALRAQRSPDPYPTFYAKKEISRDLTDPRREYRGDEGEPRLTMLEALREVFRTQMERDERVVLFGEDIEDPEDVFGVTRGLTTAFPGRVRNAPLSEASIVGFAGGEAVAGRRPVAFLQFADFMSLGFNQIMQELGTMHWRTDGGWDAPTIVMAACGGYKPGLGPFHSSSLEAIALHTPGLDVFMPSNAADAAGLLNAAFQSGRPTVFFYPKNLLNNHAHATSADVERQIVPIGKSRVVETGDDLTFVAWGNTVPLCLKAAKVLRDEGFSADVIDLRSLSPWDQDAVLESAERTGRLLVVHEDNQTCGFGGEVISTVMENAETPVLAKRLTRADTYVPFNSANQLEVLPSFKSVLETSLEMLGATVTWEAPPKRERGTYLIEAMGSSPLDESVTVVDWQIKVGDTIEVGTIVANLEADRAAQALPSPVPGEVVEFLVNEGEMVAVGTPLIRLKADEAHIPMKPVSREDPGKPIVKKTGKALVAPGGQITEQPVSAPAAIAEAAVPVKVEIGIADIVVVTGSRVVSNEVIAETCDAWTAESIFKRIGIESRYWVAEGEDTVSLGTKAARDLLARTGLTIRDIDLLIVTTGTAPATTPSTACLVLNRLAEGADDIFVQAHDLNAACTGYLYALQQAYDYLNTRPNHKVVVVTSETLSRKLDVTDPSTAPIFGDAATASLIVGMGNKERIRARVFPPELSAKGEDGSILAVPVQFDKTVFMDGPQTFVEAINGMIMMLNRALKTAGKTLEDLALIVPHQANQRIINAIGLKTRSKEKMFSNIRHYGNTSSSTIPIALSELIGKSKSGELFGLAAFGGGFTFGGGVLEIV